MADRPDVVVFDVLETLLNIDPLAAQLPSSRSRVRLCAPRRNTRRFLDGAGLAEFVDHLFTAQAAGVWKPHPEIYRFAAEQMHTPIERGVSRECIDPWIVR